MSLKIDYTGCLDLLGREEINMQSQEALDHLKTLMEASGEGSDFTGWIDLPEKSKSRSGKIKEVAGRLRSQSDITVIIGIGGSYLGARAVIEALDACRPPVKDKKEHKVLFAGQNISEDYMSRLAADLAGKVFNIIVISKSGTTTEPAIAFRILKKQLEETVAAGEVKKHIIAVTDAEKGALRKLADREGYDSFIIPDDVGGRYSVLTPVGLLPIAVAGYDIDSLVGGATEMAARTRDYNNVNPAIVYASVRNLLYNKGKYIEMLVNYEPGLHYIAEWWKQLFGESEGKEGKGLFPAAADFTTDLHSLGQYIQEGERILIETVLSVASPGSEMIIPHDADNLDGLNYIAGMRLSEVNAKAEEGTIMAHVKGAVPLIKINIPRVNEAYLGQLLYFFEISCAISAYMLGVNPFDQPGVEAYKNNMFRLLGKHS
ncbi:MAG: glucose-6-phosphate isomerase [Bacteroidales bacterium]